MARRTERDLTKGSIPGHVIALAGPAILATLVHNLYGLNDIFFSKFIGPDAQTAVSNNLFTLITIFGFVQLASIGTLALVSRRTGAGNHEGADRAARQGLIIGLGVSVAVAVLGLALTPLIPRLMGMSPEVGRESIRYLTVIFLGLPALFLAPVVDSIFRARGDTLTPLILQVIAVAANIGGNYLAVFQFDAGVIGIACSTIFSRLVWFGLGFLLLLRGRVGIRLERRPGPFLDLPLWATVVKVSAPIAARTFLFGFVYLLISRIAAQFGTSVQNGLGVGIRVEGLCFFIMVGFGLAASPLVGQNLGAGKPDRAARAAWTTVAMAMGPAIAFMAVFLLIPDQLIGVFADDPASATHGRDYLFIIAFCLVFLGLEVVLAQAFVGAGDTLPPTLIDIPLTALRVPLAWWATKGLDMGPAGIWWTICVTAIGRGVLMSLWFLRGRWKRARPDLD